jgi:hypothetical protein
MSPCCGATANHRKFPLAPAENFTNGANFRGCCVGSCSFQRVGCARRSSTEKILENIDDSGQRERPYFFNDTFPRFGHALQSLWHYVTVFGYFRKFELCSGTQELTVDKGSEDFHCMYMWGQKINWETCSSLSSFRFPYWSATLIVAFFLNFLNTFSSCGVLCWPAGDCSYKSRFFHFK